ncbi:MAG: hypothetical protein PHV55_06880 [Candidatus Omnitrophica bacterium]|nr:hypothetical protein [Candidatus Omnitrophota bacterium]
MRELFVFGAGASRASGGTPLGKDLVWDYFNGCSSWSPVGHDALPTEEAQDEQRREFADLIVFFGKIESRYPQLSGISQELNAAINEGRFADLDIGKPYYIDEIMEDLVRDTKYADEIKLVRRIAAQHITQTSYGSNNDFYKKFIKSLKNKIRDEVSIISFNFDCLLDDDLSERVYFDYLIEFDGIDSRRCFYRPGRGIILLKLHGSLDWRLDTSTGAITLLPAEWGESCGGEPCIFLPHEEVNQKISQLWNAAEESVRRADKITFIGYSLPTYDSDAIKLFQSNVHGGIWIEVIDFSKATIDRFKELFPNSKIEGTIRDLSKDG